MDYSALEALPADGVTIPRTERHFPRSLYAFVVFVGVGSAFTAFMGIKMLGALDEEGLPAAAIGFIVLWTLVAAAITAAVIFGAVRWNSRATKLVRSLQPGMRAFAEANALTYEFSLADPPLPGYLFTLPERKSKGGVVATPGPMFRLTPTTGRMFYVGDHRQWSSTMWASELSYMRPFVAVQLDRKLPRIALVPRGVDSELSLDRSQILELEGDFNTYFTLYCPDGYRTDALQVFTPDVMAAMVDHAQAWTAEIVDDWIHFTRIGPTLEAATLDEIRGAFELVEHVGSQVSEQAEHYSDPRAGARALDRIAAGGRRLKRVTPLWSIAAGVGLVLVCAAPFVMPVVTRTLFPS